MTITTTVKFYPYNLLLYVGLLLVILKWLHVIHLDWVHTLAPFWIYGIACLCGQICGKLFMMMFKNYINSYLK